MFDARTFLAARLRALRADTVTPISDVLTSDPWSARADAAPSPESVSSLDLAHGPAPTGSAPFSRGRKHG